MHRFLIIIVIACGLLPGCVQKQSRRATQNNNISEHTDIIELAKRAPMEDIDHGSFAVSKTIAAVPLKKLTFSQKKSAAQEQEARHADIPLPFNAQSIEHDFAIIDPEQVALSYSLRQPMHEAVSFYMAEMECNGWQELGCVVGSQAQLTFVKPERICSVVINPSSKNHEALEISVFSGKRSSIT